MEGGLQSNGAHNLLETLRNSPEGSRRAILVDFIERQLLDILRWDESRRKDLAGGFVQVGLDSLLAVDLQFRLQEALRFAPPPEGDEEEFQMSCAEDLADFLLAKRLNLT
jgi:acyl carrier protein